MTRPRFTLRMALVLTAVAAAVAWQGSVVQRRKGALHDAMGYANVTVIPGDRGAGSRNRPNAIRQLFGDESILSIFLSKEVPEAEVERLRRLFPEAEVERRELTVPLST
ncbi:hypothetical protein [Lacipirellula parvula]|uniref:Uncharacterized protein n=1 Tax=Lacipirellula parvula TaxID=2650471 RepID=A0A5K7XRE2_9BACT|nr:hypothetical protein [Lacipirellula parvula]BBO36489.1 hypothetical protein PLANPX_6101 [Lacipirellula parvula]